MSVKVGIVGSEGAKFTKLGEECAKDAIRRVLTTSDVSVDRVISGHCHLGGIDIWTENIADELGITKEIYPPKELNWSNGYKPRNLKIANASDIVYCISVDHLPTTYKGMVFKECYHCRKANRNCSDHIKSGGCWTVIEAMKLGKEGKWITIKNEQ